MYNVKVSSIFTGCLPLCPQGIWESGGHLACPECLWLWCIMGKPLHGGRGQELFPRCYTEGIENENHLLHPALQTEALLKSGSSFTFQTKALLDPPPPPPLINSLLAKHQLSHILAGAIRFEGMVAGSTARQLSLVPAYVLAVPNVCFSMQICVCFQTRTVFVSQVTFLI